MSLIPHYQVKETRKKNWLTKVKIVLIWFLVQVILVFPRGFLSILIFSCTKSCVDKLDLSSIHLILFIILYKKKLLFMLSKLQNKTFTNVYKVNSVGEIFREYSAVGLGAVIRVLIQKEMYFNCDQCSLLVCSFAQHNWGIEALVSHRAYPICNRSRNSWSGFWRECTNHYQSIAELRFVNGSIRKHNRRMQSSFGKF